ncbi:acyltransferase-domain-containing protein [Microthyrium microscopicum]|uniref:1-acyl-sn-glycerol-3-phosphate acyltransferase n=1 Tax=Microthyrium microscopicum TaxID=703497 RepID=A0A6A6UPJ1_9PEZI|nr:acyltransferase-domain-containing protein [Microthyrium microscopicum]
MGFLSGLVNYVALPWFLIVVSLYGLAFALPPKYAKLPATFARVLAYLAGLAICATFGVTASLVLKPFGYGGLGQYLTAVSFKWLMLPFIQVWMDVDDPHGSLKTRPAVILGNHQTELDILLLGHIFPPFTSVTAKADLKWYPFLGQFMWASNTVFIDRANHTSALATFASAASHMTRDRQNVFLFPEGTRSYYDHPDLLPFKKGGFHLAIQAQVPIVPVVCANYTHVLNLKQLKFVGGRIPVRVLKAVETKGLTAKDVPELVERVRNDMLEALKELDAEVKSKYGRVGNGTAPGLRELSEKAGLVAS